MLLAGSIAFVSCRTEHQPKKSPLLEATRMQLADKKATDETAALFYNLKKNANEHVLFGHQDATRNGFGWTNEYNSAAFDPERSDVKDVTGAYPAVYGWDFIHIANFYTGNWFHYERNLLRRLTTDAYNRGGINTYSWHYHNPITKEGVRWNEAPVEAVKHILPGGTHHGVLKKSLNEIADYIKLLIGKDGKAVPIIFRPFHEMDGDWFWWGKGHCTVQEYKQLYRFTVTYLRDSLSVHNLLYAWSPDRNFNTEEEYLAYYPGDDFVDIVGMDNYGDLSPGNSPSLAARKLEIVSGVAVKKNKVAAFTETGSPNIPQEKWFTEMLLPVLQHRQGIAYVMLWSNSREMYWTPYKGHPAENDFILFRNNPYIFFDDTLPDMYQIE
jgi:mannan endo-1,4-beta-mannosidase